MVPEGGNIPPGQQRAAAPAPSPEVTTIDALMALAKAMQSLADAIRFAATQADD